MISPDEIAADRAVIDAATGGEWQVLVGASWAGEVVVATSDGHPIAVVSTAPADPGAIADATAIAAARTGWPRALDALEVMADAVLDEMARAEQAEAAIARVRALHRAVDVYDLCGHDDPTDCGMWETVDGEFVCGAPVDRVCDECRDEDGERYSWPCATIRALDGEA